MTAAELIARLQLYDPFLLVEVCEASGEADFRITDVGFVNRVTGNDPDPRNYDPCQRKSCVTIWVEDMSEIRVKY